MRGPELMARVDEQRRGTGGLAVALVALFALRLLLRREPGRVQVLPEQLPDEQPLRADAEAAPVPAGSHRVGWRRMSPRPHSATGLAGAVLFACLSLTPSLLPRAPVFQGVVSGIAAAIGYGLGLLAGRLARRVFSWRPGERARRFARVALVVGGAAVLVVSLVVGARWQREIHRLVGAEEPGNAAPLLIVAVSVAVAVLVVAVARLLRHLVQLLAAPLGRRLPTTVAGLVAVTVVALAGGVMLNGVVYQTALSVIDRSFSVTNRGTTPGIERPSGPLRSGASPHCHPGRTWACRGATSSAAARPRRS